MKKPITEITVFTYNNRADALALANDCTDDCVVVSCVNNRTVVKREKKGLPTILQGPAEVPCCYIVVNNNLLAELIGALK